MEIQPLLYTGQYTSQNGVVLGVASVVVVLQSGGCCVARSDHLTRLGQRGQRTSWWRAGARRQVGRALLERSHGVEGGHFKYGG